ncbi:MAG TPA: STAS domain-containing protein [Polyangiaceae bacterium]|jgi:hypothetical protein|nr:STAS domain-containing protein [Polyangiaceae bacterium]
MLRSLGIRTEGFALVLADTGAVPVVRLSGNGDGEVVAPLDRTLKQLHEELVDASVRSVVVDLGELYFMNSSCLKAFVSWIYKVRTSGKPYQIRIQYNPNQRWQQRGLEPLQRLAPAVVFLDQIGASKSSGASAASGQVNGGRNG